MWRECYRRVELKADIYPDAVEGLRRWHAAGHRLALYSSGSVAAQKLLFANTEAGDLSRLFDGYFDTEVGHKREAGSYAAIARKLGDAPDDIVFLSDVVAELDAERDAGMSTVLLDRYKDDPHTREDRKRAGLGKRG